MSSKDIVHNYHSTSIGFLRKRIVCPEFSRICMIMVSLGCKKTQHDQIAMYSLYNISPMNIFPKVYLRRPWINHSFTANTPYHYFLSIQPVSYTHLDVYKRQPLVPLNKLSDDKESDKMKISNIQRGNFNASFENLYRSYNLGILPDRSSAANTLLSSMSMVTNIGIIVYGSIIL